MNSASFNQALLYTLLNILKEEPHPQKGMADRMGVSAGKVNYCIKEFTKKGNVKVWNFRDSTNKKRYLYILTPKGIEERVKVSIVSLFCANFSLAVMSFSVRLCVFVVKTL